MTKEKIEELAAQGMRMLEVKLTLEYGEEEARKMLYKETDDNTQGRSGAPEELQ